jgi:DNA-binding NtrC family response regulator
MNKNLILVIDDDDVLRGVVADLLADEFPGFEVMDASNGSLGLKIIHSRVPVVVISDVHMPEMGGLEVLKRVKEEFLEIGVILMSGEMSKKEAERLSIDFFLSKPFVAEDLTAMVDKIISKGR